MDGRTDAQSIDRGKILGGKSALSIEDRRHGVFGPRKCRAERIANGLEHVAVVRGDRRSHQRVVPAHGILHRRAVAVPARSAAFDIRKQKRDGAGRASRGRGAPVSRRVAMEPRFVLGALPSAEHPHQRLPMPRMQDLRARTNARAGRKPQTLSTRSHSEDKLRV